MSKKVTDLVFEELSIDYGLRVWCDLSGTQLSTIEGVKKVWWGDKGYHKVYVDKRYSLYDVKEEIYRLAGYEPKGWFGILGWKKIDK